MDYGTALSIKVSIYVPVIQGQTKKNTNTLNFNFNSGIIVNTEFHRSLKHRMSIIVQPLDNLKFKIDMKKMPIHLHRADIHSKTTHTKNNWTSLTNYGTTQLVDNLLTFFLSTFNLLPIIVICNCIIIELLGKKCDGLQYTKICSVSFFPFRMNHVRSAMYHNS